MEDRVATLSVGVVRLVGEDALDLLNRLSTNDLAELPPGTFSHTLLTTSQGKLIDWLRVASLDDQLTLITSPGRAERVAEWLEQYTIMEDSSARVVNEQVPLTRWLGPTAGEWVESKIASPTAVLSTETGLLMRAPRELGQGADFIGEPQGSEFGAAIRRAGVKALTEELYERERIAAGIPSPAAEFQRDINPLELRLEKHAVSFSKGCYVGQEVLSRLDSYNKVARRLMGFECDVPLAPRDDVRITLNGKTVGRVTSTSVAETTVGLAIVNQAAVAPQDVVIKTADDTIAARLLDRPFWLNG